MLQSDAGCIPADGVRDGGDAAPRAKRAGQRRQRRQHVRQPLRPGATLRRGPYGQVRRLPGACVCILLSKNLQVHELFATHEPQRLTHGS